MSCVLCQAAVKLTARKEDETECVMAIFPGFQVTEARVSGLWLHSLKDRRVQDYSPSQKRLWMITVPKCSVLVPRTAAQNRRSNPHPHELAELAVELEADILHAILRVSSGCHNLWQNSTCHSKIQIYAHPWNMQRRKGQKSTL